MPAGNGNSGQLWPSVEQHLLLQAALLPRKSAIAAFRQWRERVDPDGQFGNNEFRLLPLVYHNLSRHGVDDPLMARLRGVYRRAWCESHQLFHRTAPAIARVAAAGCDVLLLKGAPLVLSYYRNHALRPMADIDLAVQPGQARRAADALAKAGFHSHVPLSDDLVRFSHALQFTHPDGGEIDLHWHILFEAGHAAADRGYWAATEALEFMGTSVRQPNPTSMLLQVIAHGIRWNPETPIRWIPDSLTILRERRADIDWDALVKQARAQKLSYRLGLGLRYLAERFAAPIPSPVLQQLRPRPTLVERIENTVLLADGSRYEGTAWGAQWVAFTEYCRYAAPGGAVGFLNGYTQYLRFRWGLSGRRELVPAIVRGVGRRLGKGGS